MNHATLRIGAIAGLGAGLALATVACSSSAPTHAAGSVTTRQAADTAAGPFLDRFQIVSQIASTVPANGDVNPYGVAVVPESAGRLVRGDVLVSNFNDKANIQGTGTTVVQVAPDGTVSPFAKIGTLPAGMSCPGGIGLTTALAVLPGGWVVVGSLPTASGGTLPAANPLGCLLVLNSQGKPVQSWTGPQINGPWDMTAQTSSGHASLFVSNVLSRPSGGSTTPPPSGLCNVIRLNVSLPSGGPPRLTSTTVIGTGFPWRQNKAALIQGPTGVALGRNGTLYVASTVGNSISAIPDAVTRTTAAAGPADVLTSGGGLNGPLGLTGAPNGDLIAVNGNNGNAVEVTLAGHQIVTRTLVPGGAGDLFGLAPAADGNGLLFVNDGTNALDLLSG
jgi:hypothetical protein